MFGSPLSEGDARPSLPAILGILAAVAGVAGSLTLLFLGMRSVMEIGGACADGGPYVPARPCPKGVALAMMGGVWMGLLFVFAYAFQVARHAVPSIVGLFWPALFISLGWNFLEYGLDPPFGGGIEWGWMVCAVVFILMGGIPLWIWASVALRRKPPPSPLGRLPASLRPVLGVPRRLDPGPTAPSDLAEVLERLDALHRSGALDDSEYRAAKRKAIGG